MRKNVNNDVSKDSPIHGYTWVYRVYMGIQGIHGYTGYTGVYRVSVEINNLLDISISIWGAYFMAECHIHDKPTMPY